MRTNRANSDQLVNARSKKWADFFATLEPFDLGEVLKNARSNDVPRPVDVSWLTSDSQTSTEE